MFAWGVPTDHDALDERFVRPVENHLFIEVVHKEVHSFVEVVQRCVVTFTTFGCLFEWLKGTRMSRGVFAIPND